MNMCLKQLKSTICSQEIEFANSLSDNLIKLRMEKDSLQAILANTNLDKTELSKKLIYYQNLSDSCANTSNQLNQLVAQLQDSNKAKDLQINDITGQLSQCMSTDSNLFDSDYPKTQEHYQKRYIFDEYSKKTYLDMYPQEFIFSDAYLLNEAKAQIFNRFHPQTEKDIVGACWSWIGADAGLGAIYRPDDYFGTPWNDFWQFPQETIALKKGDCEDLAILWKSLCDKCGVPIYKTRVHLGMYGQTGHCYGAYKPSKDSKELLIEATQRYVNYSAPLTTLESHPEYTSYYAFNSKYMWKIRSGIEFGKLVEKIKVDKRGKSR